MPMKRAKKFFFTLAFLAFIFKLEANDIGALKTAVPAFQNAPQQNATPASPNAAKEQGKVVTPNLRNILKSLPKANKADASVPRLDASSQERLQQSFADMLLSISDDFKQQAFAGAMATIGVVFAQNPDELGSTSMLELLDGRNADEIIAISRKLTPQIRQNTMAVDGSNAENFGKSIGGIMVSLPVEKQGEFSEAIAKLMYEAKQKGEADTSIARKLDGKTAQEIIDMAAKIELPFKIGGKLSPNEVEIGTPTEKDFKDFNIELPKQEGKKEEGSYTPSLVPSSNL